MGMDAGTGEVKSEINITPLVDVVLVLLIIFMVITPLMQRGFDTNLPQKATVATPPSGAQIVVVIDGAGNIQINKESILANELGSKMQEILNTRADKAVFIKADDKTKYETVVKAVDACHNAGALTIAFIMD